MEALPHIVIRKAVLKPLKSYTGDSFRTTFSGGHIEVQVRNLDRGAYHKVSIRLRWEKRNFWGVLALPIVEKDTSSDFIEPAKSVTLTFMPLTEDHNWRVIGATVDEGLLSNTRDSRPFSPLRVGCDPIALEPIHFCPTAPKESILALDRQSSAEVATRGHAICGLSFQ